MKIINSGDVYEVRGDALKTYNSLPPQVYTVGFSPMGGFYLERHADVEVNEPKIYGPHEAKAEKVLKSYRAFSRNLGVLLSGDKGMGKSMFARILSKKAVEMGLPLIIVDTYYKGIANYIEKIEQEAVVLFDEFDKIFSYNSSNGDGVNPQTELLSLFDGLSSGKKMFVITCNNINDINEYLVNRPGRFHYHIRFDYPDANEIREYLEDKLVESRKSEISKIISFARKASLNYDCLRAIVFELNNSDEKFEEAIKDLNILNISEALYTSKVFFKSGTVITSNISCNMFSGNFVSMAIYENEHDDYIGRISFVPNQGKYDMHTGNIVFSADMCKLSLDDDVDESLVAGGLDCVILEKKKSDNLHFVL